MTDKSYMFQYCDGHDIKINTDLITREEALELWEKHYPEAVERIKNYEDIPFMPNLGVAMVIWEGCRTNSNYHSELAEINHIDCVVEGGQVYQKVLVPQKLK